jgi:hypothetical protein
MHISQLGTYRDNQCSPVMLLSAQHVPLVLPTSTLTCMQHQPHPYIYKTKLCTTSQEASASCQARSATPTCRNSTSTLPRSLIMMQVTKTPCHWHTARTKVPSITEGYTLSNITYVAAGERPKLAVHITLHQAGIPISKQQRVPYPSKSHLDHMKLAGTTLQ